MSLRRVLRRLPYRIERMGISVNEKQRWLLRELDGWRTKEIKSIGHWAYDAIRPLSIRAKRVQIKKLEADIKAWEAAQTAPFNKQRAEVEKSYSTVKRVILFEKTENALKAIKALR